MTRSAFVLPALAALGALAAACGPAKADPRAVLELFTSQGCSSCPPADRLLGDLANDPTLVALSVPIDYWDYLGWKDTLARPRHTARQRGYASMRGDRNIYTPQVVVNGLAHAVGSDRAAIENAIARTQHKGGALSIPVHLDVQEDAITVRLAPARDGDAVAEVWLCATAKAVPVAIRKGENRGRTLTYHNVVRHWIKIGTWTGGQQSWTIARAEFESEDTNGIAVLVQAGGNDAPGAVLGATAITLR
ncbi:MAG: DUF1223 domain-containing protein [Variibacter sp.]|nr:DUF1223 domain-containing protein [Variibacter sp.]